MKAMIKRKMEYNSGKLKEIVSWDFGILFIFLLLTVLYQQNILGLCSNIKLIKKYINANILNILNYFFFMGIMLLMIRHNNWDSL
jgi:hypothetical protein